MFFVMIVFIILTAVGLGRMIDPYTPQALARAFRTVAAAALLLGVIGVIGLEGRSAGKPVQAERITWRESLKGLAANPSARRFFLYLVLLLVAILGQDLLLEPYAGTAFRMSVRETTGITSIWGTCTLICLAAGLATVSNLSLMLDMTAAGRVGLFMGAWGMADAAARLGGNVLSGAVRDSVSLVSGVPLAGYGAVFGIQAAVAVVSLAILARVDVESFRRDSIRAGRT